MPAGRKGSPIIYYGKSVQERLQKSLGDKFDVYIAMRYKNLSIDDVLVDIYKKKYEKIIVVPSFHNMPLPQQAQ